MCETPFCRQAEQKGAASGQFGLNRTKSWCRPGGEKSSTACLSAASQQLWAPLSLGAARLLLSHSRGGRQSPEPPAQPPHRASPPLVHLWVPPVVFPRTPAVAAQRRQRADAASEERVPSRHLRQSIFGFLRLSSPPPRGCDERSPSLDALHWAPAAFQALAALEAGAGGANAGRVVGGRAGDGDLAGAVSSCCYRFILLGTANTFTVTDTKSGPSRC